MHTGLVIELQISSFITVLYVFTCKIISQRKPLEEAKLHEFYVYFLYANKLADSVEVQN